MAETRLGWYPMVYSIHQDDIQFTFTVHYRVLIFCSTYQANPFLRPSRTFSYNVHLHEIHKKFVELPIDSVLVLNGLEDAVVIFRQFLQMLSELVVIMSPGLLHFLFKLYSVEVCVNLPKRNEPC